MDHLETKLFLSSIHPMNIPIPLLQFLNLVQIEKPGCIN